MGAKSSNGILLDTALNQPLHQVEKNYYQHIYLQHKKTSGKFRQEVKSIIKRVQYLPYPWAQTLLRSLKSADRQELYSQYKSTLKQNCVLNGKGEKVLCSSKVRKSFMKIFSQRKATMEKNITLKDLSSLTTECNSYLMVLAWLHRLATLQQATLQDIDSMLPQEQDKIFAELLMLAEKYIDSNHKISDQSTSLLFSGVYGEVVSLLQNMQKRQSFSSKVNIIIKLEALLGEKPQSFAENMRSIQKLLGRTKVLAHIFVIRQMGGTELPNANQYLESQLSIQKDYK